MKEPARKNRPRPDRERRVRHDDEEEAPSRPPRGRGPSAEELLELADELEEQGRALLSRARQLQRMAQALESGGREPRESRGPREGRGSGESRGPRGPGRGARPAGKARGGGGRDDRPPRRPGGAPEWTPERKRRKP